MKKLLSIGLALTMAACGGRNSQTTGNSGAADDGAVKKASGMHQTCFLCQAA